MNEADRRRIYVTLICAAIASTPLPASAQIFSNAVVSPAVKPTPAEPTADLKVFSATSQKVKWSGEGSNAVAFDLCVASSTGRFRLQVTSQSGGTMLGAATGGKLGFSIRFRDASGQVQEKTLGGQAVVEFEGSSPAQQDCSTGANASIEIDNKEGDMLAQPAGDYMDRLLLSAEPL